MLFLPKMTNLVAFNVQCCYGAMSVSVVLIRRTTMKMKEFVLDGVERPLLFAFTGALAFASYSLCR